MKIIFLMLEQGEYIRGKQPYIIDDKGLKIGVYACAEHEFSIAAERSAGAIHLIR